MTSFVTVKHNSETAHRLHALGGKCANFHGHSWNIDLTVTGNLRRDIPIIVDFGSLKKDLRWFVDTFLDHGTMIGYDDPMRDDFVDDGGKLFIFGNTKWKSDLDNSNGGAPVAEFEKYAEDLPWPTVEGVALLISRVMCFHFGYEVTEVTVSETAVNTATWKKG